MTKKKDEDNLFRTIFKGMKPLKQDKHCFEPKSPPLPRPRPSASSSEPVLPHTPLTFDIWGDVTADKILRYNPNKALPDKAWRRLQRGGFPVEASLDLHGENLEGASEHVSRFLAKAYEADWRIVCIVHGKGGDNRDRPVLKNALVQWLREFPQVVAYCSCPPAQGGTGAILVYVKRQR